MASVAEELHRCLSYALKRLGTPELQLKAEQRSAIESVYRGKDVFVWLPTGFGKSICYQTLPFVFDSKLGRVNSQCGSVVLVVSPLIALMVDQVVGLRERGANAAVITTGLVPRQFFCTRRGKIIWSTGYSIFVPSATFVALQSECFMRMTLCTALDGDQRWLGS